MLNSLHNLNGSKILLNKLIIRLQFNATLNVLFVYCRIFKLFCPLQSYLATMKILSYQTGSISDSLKLNKKW